MYDERIILQIEMANPEADLQSQSQGSGRGGGGQCTYKENDFKSE